ncbi:MAG: PRTRC system protein F [Hydrogenophaga sp.]|uniref:PRTRC system protein F n=1 Tax=Hydrogenophaga sp. TaxID=1904254 RepID=UPI0027349889|nr:PRTRC system protein F [Hydrogenophaga sp.]MDP3350513.1 PRTRC system protein F [Hydrogenophaga sp.]
METAEIRPARSHARSLPSLPEISSEVPASLQRANTRSQILARLVLAAEAHGLKLPGGPFAQVNDVLTQQWAQYCDAVSPELGRLLLGEPEILVSDDLLDVVINARPDINTFFMKAVVESLEKVAAGLGWFVVSVLQSARGSGFAFYDLTVVSYHLESRFWDLDEFTDECYASHLLMEEGDREYGDDSKPTEDDMARLREQYQFWPSQILEAAGGHDVLLGGVVAAKDSKKPRVAPMKPSAVHKWIKANSDHAQLECVKAALALQKHLSKKEATALIFDSGPDDTQAVGGMCFLAWEDPQMVWESANHAEEYAYNGGDVMEAVARKTLQLDKELTDGDLSQLVVELKAYINGWHLFERLMSHFPQQE